MERMEVDQCAGAAGGAAGGALRRSNSAPMITSVSDGMAMFSPVSSARYRRSSVSINPSGPSQLVPLSPFSATRDRPDHKRQEENMETILRGSLQRLSASSLIPVHPASQWHNHTSVWSQESGVTPSSSPSPPRRFSRGGHSEITCDDSAQEERRSRVRRTPEEAFRCRSNGSRPPEQQLHLQRFTVGGGLPPRRRRQSPESVAVYPLRLPPAPPTREPLGPPGFRLTTSRSVFSSSKRLAKLWKPGNLNPSKRVNVSAGDRSVDLHIDLQEALRLRCVRHYLILESFGF
ncbi:uncharacterized protein AB9W97_010143 isoform 1-T1 [Spinachia spinachia]